MKKMNFPSKEYELLEYIKPYFNESSSRNYPIGVGDDAAVRACKNERIILTTDVSVENVHFSLSYMNLEEVAYKSMVSNISDCASMGAVPDSALIQVVFPGDVSNIKDKLISLYKGFGRACKKWRFPIVGGDLSKGANWVIAITLLGSMQSQSNILKRSSAVPGDFIWVSGYPGESYAGLEVMRRFGRKKVPYKFNYLVKKHVSPQAEIELGLHLSARNDIHAVMDISDGVSKECKTLSHASNCGIELYQSNFPIRSGTKKFAELLDWNPEDWFLNGGEDYELIFTASSTFDPNSVKSLKKFNLTMVGKCVASHKDVHLLLPNGNTKLLSNTGWDHFSDN